MKSKLLLALVLSLPIAAQAGTIAAAAAPSAASVTATGMVTQGFTITLSKGVSMGYTIGAAATAVQTIHDQSTNAFGGGTSGGSVKKCPTAVTAGTAAAAPEATGDGCGA